MPSHDTEAGAGTNSGSCSCMDGSSVAFEGSPSSVPNAQRGRSYGLCGQPFALDVIGSSLLMALLHPVAHDPVRVLAHLLSLDSADHLALVGAITEAGCTPQDLISAYLHNVRVLQEDKVCSDSTPAADNIANISRLSHELLSELGKATAVHNKHLRDHHAQALAGGEELLAKQLEAAQKLSARLLRRRCSGDACPPSPTPVRRRSSSETGISSVLVPACAATDGLQSPSVYGSLATVDYTTATGIPCTSSEYERWASAMSPLEQTHATGSSSAPFRLLSLRPLSEAETAERELLVACNSTASTSDVGSHLGMPSGSTAPTAASAGAGTSGQIPLHPQQVAPPGYEHLFHFPAPQSTASYGGSSSGSGSSMLHSRGSGLSHTGGSRDGALSASRQQSGGGLLNGISSFTPPPPPPPRTASRGGGSSAGSFGSTASAVGNSGMIMLGSSGPAGSSAGAASSQMVQSSSQQQQQWMHPLQLNRSAGRNNASSSCLLAMPSVAGFQRSRIAGQRSGGLAMLAERAGGLAMLAGGQPNMPSFLAANSVPGSNQLVGGGGVGQAMLSVQGGMPAPLQLQVQVVGGMTTQQAAQAEYWQQQQQQAGQQHQAGQQGLELQLQLQQHIQQQHQAQARAQQQQAQAHAHQHQHHRQATAMAQLHAQAQQLQAQQLQNAVAMQGLAGQGGDMGAVWLSGPADAGATGPASLSMSGQMSHMGQLALGEDEPSTAGLEMYAQLAASDPSSLAMLRLYGM